MGMLEALVGPRKPFPCHLLPELLVLLIPCAIDGGLASKDISSSLGLGGRCRAGWRAGQGRTLASTQPHRFLCILAGHHASTDGVRGGLNYLSNVLRKNLRESCNWLQWICRVIYGFHLKMPSVISPWPWLTVSLLKRLKCKYSAYRKQVFVCIEW